MTPPPTMIRAILIGLTTLLLTLFGGPSASAVEAPTGSGAVTHAQPRTMTNPCPGNSDALHESYTYDQAGLGLPTTLFGSTGVVLGTDYDAYSNLSLMTLGVSAANTNRVTQDFERDGLGRLSQFLAYDDPTAGAYVDTTYTYNNSDEITTAFDDGGGTTQNQCYIYGNYRELVRQSTTKGTTPGDCTPGPTSATVGGAAPYWTSYTYNAVGQRTAAVKHAFTGGPASSTTSTYTYGAKCTSAGTAWTPSARVLTSVAATTGSTTATSTYCDNKTGQRTDATTGSGADQTLTWDYAGRLASSKQVTSAGTVQSNQTDIYDADGNLLEQRANNDGGTTTLYLGDTEVHASVKAGVWSVNGERYYSQAGHLVGVRKGVPGAATTLTFLATDQQGTTTAAWTATSTASTHVKRYTDAFGVPVTSPTWIDSHRFLDKTYNATTGLAYIGAREYDPALGQFISADPLIDTADALSLNSYSYADNNPVTNSDPTGMLCDNGNSSCTHALAQHSTDMTKKAQNAPAPAAPTVAITPEPSADAADPSGSRAESRAIYNSEVAVAYGNAYARAIREPSAAAPIIQQQIADQHDAAALASLRAYMLRMISLECGSSTPECRALQQLIANSDNLGAQTTSYGDELTAGQQYTVESDGIGDDVVSGGADTGISVFRTPRIGAGKSELENGLDPAKFTAGDQSAYVGDEAAARTLAHPNVGSYENGYTRFDMHPDFEGEFSKFKYSYAEGGPGSYEYQIPQSMLPRFNELTLSRTWIPFE